MNWYAYCGNNPLNFTDPTGTIAVVDDFLVVVAVAVVVTETVASSSELPSVDIPSTQEVVENIVASAVASNPVALVVTTTAAIVGKDIVEDIASNIDESRSSAKTGGAFGSPGVRTPSEDKTPTPDPASKGKIAVAVKTISDFGEGFVEGFFEYKNNPTSVGVSPAEAWGMVVGAFVAGRILNK